MIIDTFAAFKTLIQVKKKEEEVNISFSIVSDGVPQRVMFKKKKSYVKNIHFSSSWA